MKSPRFTCEKVVIIHYARILKHHRGHCQEQKLLLALHTYGFAMATKGNYDLTTLCVQILRLCAVFCS